MIGAKKLPNSRVILKLCSIEVALWLRREKVAFEEDFGMSEMKDRMVSVLIEYVLITHCPDALAENRKVKHDFGLEKDMPVTTRWIKPVKQ